MASELLGRTVCPECNFQSAHIKLKTDKEGAKPYRHCPECGAQYFPRSLEQAEKLREKIKTAKLDQPAPTASKVIPTLTEPEKKTRVVFGVRMPVDD